MARMTGSPVSGFARVARIGREVQGKWPQKRDSRHPHCLPQGQCVDTMYLH